MTGESDNELPIELELEALRAGSLPEPERSEVLSQLRERYPEHVPLIEALGGLGTCEGAKADAITHVGSYRVKRDLGGGGMGRVLLGSRDDEEDVALKVLRPEIASDYSQRRFRREVHVLQGLEHEAIARFVDADEGEIVYADGRRFRMPYLAMEFVDGLELREFAEKHALDARQRVRLFVRICEAIGHAHARDVVHRDIKPANILVVDDGDVGRPKVLDFGIASALEVDESMSLTMTGQGGLLGTAAYMSPEQISGGAKDLDARSDVYSLGVVLFELLVGKLPYSFDSRSLPEIARVIHDAEPTRLGTADTRFRGTSLEVILAKALEKEARQRYADASQVAMDLESFLGDSPIVARAPSLSRRAARFARRYRVLVSVTATTLLALSVGLFAAVRFALSEARLSEEASALAYRASMAAADAALARHDVATAGRILSRLPESAAGIELDYLRSRLDDSLASFRSPVRRAAINRPTSLHFDPAGGLVGTLTARDRSLVWRVVAEELPTTELVSPLLESPHRVVAAVGSRGEWLAIASPKVAMRSVADLPRRAAGALPFAGAASQGQLVASACGRGWLLVRSGGRAEWIDDTETKRPFRLAGWPRANPDDQTAHATRRWLAATAGRRLLFWRSDDGGPPVEIPSHGPRFCAIAASPDGRRFAVGGTRGTLLVFRVPDVGSPHREQRFLGHRGMVRALAFDHESKRVITGGDDRTVRFWDLEAGELLDVRLGSSDSVQELAIEAGEHRVAALSRSGMVRVFDTDDSRDLPHADGATALAVDGDLIYSGAGDGVIRLFDVRSGVEVTQFAPLGGRVNDIALSPNGRWLAVSVHGRLAPVFVLDANTGARLAKLENERQKGNRCQAVFAPDNSVLVTRSRSGQLTKWSTDDWRQLRRVKLPVAGRATLLFSLDGETLVAGGTNRDLVFLDCATLERQASIPAGMQVRTLATDPPGRRICAAGRDGEIKIWDWSSREVLAEFSANEDLVLAAEFAPDGRRLATAGTDAQLHIWDIRRREEIVALTGHSEFVRDVVYVDDGTIVTASFDRTARLWDGVTSGERRTAAQRWESFAKHWRTRIEQAVRAGTGSRGLHVLEGWTQLTDREREIARQLYKRIASRR